MIKYFYKYKLLYLLAFVLNHEKRFSNVYFSLSKGWFSCGPSSFSLKSTKVMKITTDTMSLTLYTDGRRNEEKCSPKIFQKTVYKKDIKAYTYYMDSWNNTVKNSSWAYYFLFDTLLGVLMDIYRKYTRNFSYNNHARWWLRLLSKL